MMRGIKTVFYRSNLRGNIAEECCKNVMAVVSACTVLGRVTPAPELDVGEKAKLKEQLCGVCFHLDFYIKGLIYPLLQAKATRGRAALLPEQ